MKKDNVNTEINNELTVPTSGTKVDETKYTKEELINASLKVANVEKYVAVGALTNVLENELTKDEFKRYIENFIKRKVVN